MTIEHKLEIILPANDIAEIVADHINKGLGSDFKVHAEQIEFNLTVVPSLYDNDTATTKLRDISVKAEYIDPKSRRSH